MYKQAQNLEVLIKDAVPINAAGANKFADAIGVEIELEGAGVANATPEVLSYWSPHNDQSLRAHNGGQAIEYVFKGPYDEPAAIKAIDFMFDFLNGPKVKVHDSYRTSIHVHLNMALETYRTVYNFMTLSLILDELLVSQNGDHRIGNNFCLRARDAMGQTNSLIHSVITGNEFFGLDQNGRYSSINFASLTKFGSVEFRSLECTTHKGRLMHWIGTLQAIKKAARLFKDPQEIINKFSVMGYKDFLFMVLGPYAIKYSTIPGLEDMLRVGMRIAQDFAYCSEWKSVQPNEKMIPVPKGSKVKYKPYYDEAQPAAFWKPLGAQIAPPQPYPGHQMPADDEFGFPNAILDDDDEPDFD